MLHRGQQDLQLLGLGGDRAGAEVGVAGDGSVQGGLLLTVGSVGHRHPLLAPLGLHGGDVEHEVRVVDPRPRLRIAHHAAVLPEGVADPAHVEVGLRDLDLATHRLGLARILTVRVPTVGFEKYLILLTFSAKIIQIIQNGCRQTFKVSPRNSKEFGVRFN